MYRFVQFAFISKTPLEESMMSENRIKYSIVVPVYNAEKYLERCVESLLRQRLTDYEIILVNDGSTDNSHSLCYALADKHLEVRVIDQQNAGVCAARNHGIDQARGEWIILADADDYMLDGGLAKVFDADTDDKDVVQFASSYDYWPKPEMTNNIAFQGTGLEHIAQHGFVSFCWLLAYRKSFLDEHQLRFDNRYIVGEDQLFVANVLLHNPRMLAVDTNLYRYVINDGSATTKRDVQHTRRCVDDYLHSFHDIMCLAKEYGDEQVVHAVEAALNQKKMFGFSRILSSQYSWAAFRRVARYAKEINFRPVQPASDGTKAKAIAAVMNMTLSSFICYKPASWLFTGIITPYVLPRLRMNAKQ